MRVHRIHTVQNLQPGAEIVLEERSSHYLGRVLRLAPGQAVVLFNGDGHDYAAEILSPARRGMALRVDSRLPGLPEPPLDITVAQAVSRGERMDQTLQKCTELGAATFQPLLSERVEVRLGRDKLTRRMEHWRGVVISACEQSGRSRVPEVCEPMGLADWLGRPARAKRLVLDPAADVALVRAALDFGPGEPVEIAAGPEGGFTETELTQMSARSVLPVSLGPRILRTETAAPAAVAVLQSLLGDLR